MITIRLSGFSPEDEGLLTGQIFSLLGEWSYDGRYIIVVSRKTEESEPCIQVSASLPPHNSKTNVPSSPLISARPPSQVV